ncbi:MAG: UDP-3-O-(3-hydroxymyristoyl)glucosamine N-acyltransferase [Chitinophagales bacterium]
MQMTALQWNEILGGTIEGNRSAVITHPAKIEEAGEGAVSFIAQPRYIEFAYTTHASLLIIDNNFVLEKAIKPTIIRVEQPYLAFSKVLEKFNKPDDDLVGIEDGSFIDSTATIASNAYVGAFSYIGKNVKIGQNVKIFPNVFVGNEVEIGDGTVIYSGVNIYHECRIGKNCMIHSGVVIGSDGFGFAPVPEGGYKKIPQLGNVVLQDNIEVGANTTIDRATLGSTRIHTGVKLDNLIHIAHNVEIGEHTVIAAQTGISGSTRIGKNCRIGGQVGLVGHLVIADGSRINAQSGVSKSINEKNKAVTGSPAFDYHSSLKSQAFYRNLPALVKRLEELELRVKEFEHDAASIAK